MDEGYGDPKYNPDKLQKQLPKGYKYGHEEQGKGDHRRRSLMTPDGKDTDITIGGAYGGKKKYSPSWGDGHKKSMKILKGIDKEVDDIQRG